MKNMSVEKKKQDKCMTWIKKISLVFICVLLISGCQSRYTVDYGHSSLYSKQDLKQAVKIILKEFNTWDGCSLRHLQYLGDKKAKSELQYCRSLKKKDYQEAIVFSSSFHTSKDVEGGFESQEEYTDWQWFLARTKHGKWELLTWGYA